MADSSRVEELRKRYHENPRRFFAPLANEYRKTGFLDRALLLCEKHLGEQPGNMNGLIVYGQTLFESGRHADAKAPFEAALQLDPENLIALRHLGDIARLSGDQEAARGWYQRVLEFDRRNDEVMELLVQVGGAVREPSSGPSARPSTIRVAPSVTATAAETPPERPRTPASPAAPAAPVRDAEFHSAKTVEITPRPRPTPLAEAKTLEIDPQPARPRTPTPASAPRTPTPAPRTPTPVGARRPPTPRSATPPAPRASLLDIDFDFSDTAPAGTPIVPPAAPATPAAAPGEGTGITWESEPGIELPPESVSARASAPIIDLPPEPVSLGDIPVVEGLQVAEFSADVAPLSGLEPAEFEATGMPAAALPDLEPSSFEGSGLAAGGLEGLETTEFETPAAALPSLPDLDTEEFVLGAPAKPAPPSSSIEDAFELAEPEAGPPMAPPAVTPAEAAARRTQTPSSGVSSPSDGLLDADLDFELEGEPAPPAAAPAIVTETMATLYLSQGFRAQAIEVYRQLIVQDPTDESLREKLAALEAEAAAPAVEASAPVVPQASAVVEPASAPVAEPASAPRPSMEFDTPVDGTAATEQPPANAMLAEVSFADVALETPVSAGRTPTPAAAMPVPAGGPTAREFLSAFVHRRATPSAGAAGEPNYAIPATLSPLDRLFGIEAAAEDQRAANRLASVGTTSAPSGGSVLDGLFTIGTAAAPAPRPSVPRASEKLKFDQFFSASSSPATGTRPATPAPEPPSARPPGDDDLDQFQGWLRGLTP